MKKLFARAIPPQDIIKYHEEQFEGAYIFYRNMPSLLYRWKMPAKVSAKLMGILLQHSVNVKRNVVFIHKKKKEDCMIALHEAGYMNFIWAEPNPADWN